MAQFTISAEPCMPFDEGDLAGLREDAGQQLFDDRPRPGRARADIVHAGRLDDLSAAGRRYHALHAIVSGHLIPRGAPVDRLLGPVRSEEHTSELQSLMRISYAVFCLKKKKIKLQTNVTRYASN